MYGTYKQVWHELTAEGAPFQVEEIEVRGSPMRVYGQALPSLREVWVTSAAFAEQDYLVYRQERWSYAQAHSEVSAIANWLKAQGVKPGDRVAIALRNYPEWLLVYWACVATGVTVVGMNAWWVEDEMAYGLTDASPSVLFCDEERLARFLNIRNRFADLLTVGIRLPGTVEGVIDYADVRQASGDSLPEVQVDPDDDACIFYTSGTTGYPKGARLTHRGCVHNIMNLAFAGQLTALATSRIQNKPVPDPKDAPSPAALVTTPFFHVTANNCVAHVATLNGGKLVLMHKWDPLEALKLMEAEKITAMSGVPVMAREVVNHPDFSRYDTSTLATLGGGGSQLHPDLVGKIGKMATKPTTGYGMTETSGIITSISGDFFLDKPASCGPAMPVFEARIVNAEGRDLPSGETGELWVRGAPVIKGYLNQPEATAQAITDGWMHTGDMASMDEDGFIFIVDRLKDMLLRGGENIYCSEVESSLHQISEIAECSVFGVPDERLGEEVGAAIHLKAGAEISAGEIRAWCMEHMARHKVPRYIWFSREPLPRNANGKFMKRELKDTLNPKEAL